MPFSYVFTRAADGAHVPISDIRSLIGGTDFKFNVLITVGCVSTCDGNWNEDTFKKIMSDDHIPDELERRFRNLLNGDYVMKSWRTRT